MTRAPRIVIVGGGVGGLAAALALERRGVPAISFRGPGERFAAATLLEDEFVIVMRSDHPASRRRLSPAAFAALPHLEISSAREDTGFVDRWLAERAIS